MVALIKREQDPESISSLGKRLAAMVLSRSQEQLTRVVATEDVELLNKIADGLYEAERMLSARRDLVHSALARLMVVDDPALNASANPQA